MRGASASRKGAKTPRRTFLSCPSRPPGGKDAGEAPALQEQACRAGAAACRRANRRAATGGCPYNTMGLGNGQPCRRDYASRSCVARGGGGFCRPYGTCDLRDAEAPTTEVVGYYLSSLRDLEPCAFLSANGAPDTRICAVPLAISAVRAGLVCYRAFGAPEGRMVSCFTTWVSRKSSSGGLHRLQHRLPAHFLVTHHQMSFQGSPPLEKLPV